MVHSAKTSKLITAKNKRISVILKGLAVSAISLTTFGFVRAYADSPAVTDFGLVTVVPAAASEERTREAIFLTMRSDGSASCEWHVVTDDAIATFATNRSAWRSDEPLHWFLQVPVYTREVKLNDSTHDAV